MTINILEVNGKLLTQIFIDQGLKNHGISH